MKYWAEFIHFHLRKCIWKYRLRNVAMLSRPQWYNSNGDLTELMFKFEARAWVNNYRITSTENIPKKTSQLFCRERCCCSNKSTRNVLLPMRYHREAMRLESLRGLSWKTADWNRAINNLMLFQIEHSLTTRGLDRYKMHVKSYDDSALGLCNVAFD